MTAVPAVNTPPNTNDFSNASDDLQTIATVVNGTSSATAMNRAGDILPTLNNLVYSPALNAAASAASATIAQAAAAAALANGFIYGTTAAGITATTSTTNKYFWVVPSTQTGGAIDLYLNSSGTAVYKSSMSAASLAATVTALSARTAEVTYLKTDFQGVLWTVEDTVTNRIALGVGKDGTLYGPDVTRINTNLTAINSATLGQSVLQTGSVPSVFSSVAEAVVDGASRVSGILKNGNLVSPTIDDLTARLRPVSPTPHSPASLLHVVSLGQSLAQGDYGTPISTTQPFADKMFDKIINPVTLTAFNAAISQANGGAGNGETVLMGLGGKFNSMRTNKRPLLLSTISNPGQPITVFANSAVTAVAQAKAAKTAAVNDVYKYGGTVWLQGEQDDNLGTALATYYAALVLIASQLDYELRNALGQTQIIPFLISQVSSHSYYRATPISAIAHYMLAKADPTRCYLIGPKYQFPANAAVHMTGDGYRAHGEKIAQVLDVVRQGKQWQPLWPLEVKRSGPRGIIARFSRSNIAFNTTLVTDPNGQKGFEVADDAGAPSLSTIEFIDNDTMHFVTSRDMSTNPFLRYAYTGTVGNVTGPTTGARGCLYSPDATVSYYNDSVSGLPYALHDWCVHFSEAVLS